MTRPIDRGPLSRRFDPSAVKESGTAVRVEASEPERQALARLCGLVAIEVVEADLLVSREGDHGARVTGQVFASVRQVCVVSLDEFACSEREAVDVLFLPEAEVAALEAVRSARHPDEDDGQDDLPDPIVAGRIDLGALVAEIFALSLDPYPKKPGAAFEDPLAAVAPVPGASPFAVLGRFAASGDE